MSSPYKTFSIHSFGCKVNFADASMISNKLIDSGLSFVNNNEIADIYIVNTCSVTENADNKANKCIKSINSKAPLSKIIVTGCYAQLEPDQISQIPGVDLVVGTKDKFSIEKFISEDEINNLIHSNINQARDFDVSYSASERTRTFIKIQDGCDYSCTYCTIPNARGLSRSGNIYDTVKKIKSIVDSGVKEIVLSGINVGDFGNKKENLHQLLIEIEKIDDLKRYRISSIEPNLLNDDIINLISSSDKALPHLHIPLQSGSDKVLRDMKRRYTVNDYKKLIKKLNNKIPNICIGVDVIVGFPTESDEDFIQTYDLIKRMKISYMHIFSYSKRPDTLAYNMTSIVNKNDVKYRRKMLQRLSKDKFNQHVEKNINHIQNVLFEENEDGFAQGLTENYIRVYVKSEQSLKNRIKKVKLIASDDNVIGQFCE